MSAYAELVADTARVLPDMVANMQAIAARAITVRR
jgi:hypothetical protein